MSRFGSSPRIATTWSLIAAYTAAGLGVAVGEADAPDEEGLTGDVTGDGVAAVEDGDGDGF